MLSDTGLLVLLVVVGVPLLLWLRDVLRSGSPAARRRPHHGFGGGGGGGGGD